MGAARAAGAMLFKLVKEAAILGGKAGAKLRSKFSRAGREEAKEIEDGVKSSSGSGVFGKVVSAVTGGMLFVKKSAATGAKKVKTGAKFLAGKAKALKARLAMRIAGLKAAIKAGIAAGKAKLKVFAAKLSAKMAASPFVKAVAKAATVATQAKSVALSAWLTGFWARSPFGLKALEDVYRHSLSTQVEAYEKATGERVSGGGRSFVGPFGRQQSVLGHASTGAYHARQSIALLNEVLKQVKTVKNFSRDVLVQTNYLVEAPDSMCLGLQGADDFAPRGVPSLSKTFVLL